MHKVILVVGNVEEAMYPFNEQEEVEPWFNEPLHENTKKQFLEWALSEDPTLVIKTFKEIVEEYGDEYTNDKWRFIDKQWQLWSIYNPQGIWDWYEEGGGWSNNLTNKSGGSVIQYRKKITRNMSIVVLL